MNSDHCTARYCRNPVWIIHLGKPLCQKHWEEYCDKEHDENMKAAELNRLALQSLTSAIADLMRVEADRNALMKKPRK